MAKRRKKRESTKRTFRPLRWLVVGTILLLVFVAVLPFVISSTALKQSIINWAAADFKGKISVEKLSISWWSPVVARGITMIDEDGNQLLRIEQLSSAKSLFSLATSSDIGKLTADGIELKLQMRGQTTNIEEALSNYINAPSSGAPLPKLQLNWSNATAEIVAAGYQRQWRVSESTGNVTIGEEGSPLTISAKGLLAHEQAPARPFQVAASFAGNETSISFADGSIEFTGDQVETSIVTPVFDRLKTPLAMAGYMNGKALIQWSDWGNRLSFSTEQASFQNLIVQSGYYLGSDRIVVESANVSGTFRMVPEGWLAEELSAETNLGRITADGLLNIQAFTNALTSGQLPKQDLRASGEIDFAKLARMLPATFPLQQDATINNAMINFQLDNWIEGDKRRAVLKIDVPRLEATRAGQQLTWNNPISVAASAHEENSQVTIEKLSCHTDFFNLEGDGTLQRASFTVQGDLQRMTNQLSELFDLGDLRFAGTINGRLGWDRTQAQSLFDPFTVGATLVITNPMVQTSTTRWAEPELNLRLVANTQLDQAGNFHVSDGTVTLVTGQDQLEAKLTDSIANVSMQSTLPLSIAVTGRLETLLAQLSPLAPLDGIRASGQLNATTKARVSLQQISIRDFRAEINSVDAEIYGMRIREPKITVDGNLDVDMTSGEVLLDEATFVSTTVSARGSKIRYQPKNKGGLGGTLSFRADLNRLTKWFPQLEANEVQWFGEATGNAKLAYDGEQIGGVISARVKDLAAAKPLLQNSAQNQPNIIQASNRNGWQVLWREDLAKLDSKLSITADLNNLRLDELTLDSSAVKLVVQGKINDLMSTMNVKLTGSWTPDFDQVSGLIAAYTGGNVSVTGGKSQSFQVSGPVFSPPGLQSNQGNAWISNTLRAETQLSWQQIQAFGLTIGPAAATARLANSAAAVQTESIPISGGSLQFAPTIHFRGSAPTIVLPESQIASEVQLTAENCRTWLKYVAPFVADASDAQGKFSLSTTGLRLPLANANAANGDAVVTIHNARIGPGPLGQQIIGIANQVKAIIEGSTASGIANQNGVWLQIPQQQIPVEIKQGRVFHRNVTFQSGSMTIQTRGSVGLDQTINMVAEVPILDRWIAGRPYLSGLQGQKISIPISGTLSKPQLDSRILKTLTTQLVQASARGAVQNELNNFMQGEGQKIQDKLFKGILNPNGGTQAKDPNGGNGLLDGAINQGLNRLFGPNK